MKKILIVLTLLPTFALACPNLIGKWESSLELFNEFNRKHALIEDKSWQFYEQLVGRTYIEFDGENSVTSMDEIGELIIGEKAYPWNSDPITSKYEVIGCSTSVMVVKSWMNNEPVFSKLNFEDKDTFWSYSGIPNGTGNDHVREYYVRVSGN